MTGDFAELPNAGYRLSKTTPFGRALRDLVTYDRYGHLLPGNEEGAAALLDAYLERANKPARLELLDDQS